MATAAVWGLCTGTAVLVGIIAFVALTKTAGAAGKAVDPEPPGDGKS